MTNTQVTMKKQKKEELYFESSAQENQQQASEKQDMEEEKEQISRVEQINQLQALQILDLFFDPVQLQDLVSIEEDNIPAKTLFLWKVHHLLGETVIDVQEQLENNNMLIECQRMSLKEIQRVVQKIIAKAQMIPQGDDFVRIKTHIEHLYRNPECDLSKVKILYNEFVKLSREFVQFEMCLDFESIQDEVRKKQNQGKGGMNLSAEITEQYGGNKTAMKPAPQQANQPNTSKPGAASEAVSTTEQKEKGTNKKWTPTQQAVFCKIYSQTDSPVVCAQLMEKQLGPDSRWKTPNQIDSKIHQLVSKVFNKFSSINSNNEAIRIFKENKKIAMECEPIIRKKIFRDIAIIYSNMLNVSEQKKVTIAHKIHEVNRLCEDASHMK